MAHRSNVTQVPKQYEKADADAATMAIDPVCGTKIDRRHARHMLFRDEDTYYFCSKDCQNKFGKSSAAAKKAA